MSRPDRTAMLDRDHPILSMRRQGTLLSLARSGVYRASAPANEDAANLALMRRLDELFMVDLPRISGERFGWRCAFRTGRG